MNERQLRSFIEVADAGSFSKASRKSYISVPAIIGQIDLLEEDIGFELFRRTNHGVDLTPSGQAFYKSVKKMLDIYDSAVHNGQTHRTADVSIGIAEGQTPDFLMPMCDCYQKLHTGSKLRFVSCPYNEQLDGVRHYLFDLAVIAEPDESLLTGLAFVPLFDDTYSFAMRPSHRLAGRAFIDLADLEGETVLCGNYSYLKQSFEKGLALSGADLKISPNEYGFGERADTLLSDQMLVFHSRWSKAYSGFMKVIPSHIPAGRVGIVCRKSAKKQAAEFVEAVGGELD